MVFRGLVPLRSGPILLLFFGFSYIKLLSSFFLFPGTFLLLLNFEHKLLLCFFLFGLFAYLLVTLVIYLRSHFLLVLFFQTLLNHFIFLLFLVPKLLKPKAQVMESYFCCFLSIRSCLSSSFLRKDSTRCASFSRRLLCTFIFFEIVRSIIIALRTRLDGEYCSWSR